MTPKRRGHSNSHMIGELFTFVLFGLFLLLSLLIVVIGVDGYRDVVDRAESISGVRTSLGYVSGKVRSDAAKDGMRIEQHDGVDVLVLTEVYEETPLHTLIYHMDGAIYETMSSWDTADFELEDGHPIIPIEDFQIGWAENNLLEMTATTDDGRAQTLHLAVRTEQGVGN